MKSFLLFSLLYILLGIPTGAWSEETYEVDDRVSVGFNVRREKDRVNIIWLYPPYLSESIDGFQTDEERSEFLRNEMQETATSGHRASEYKLGYLYLHGIGVEQDLAEAERRFRIGLDEIDRPVGACRLAEKLVFREEAEREYDRANELTLASLEAGYGNAAYVAEHIADFYSEKAKPPELEKAQRLYDASVVADPENDRALYLSAVVRLDREMYEEASDKATQLIEFPSESGYKDRAHYIRLKSAQELGWEDRLNADDIIQPVKMAFRRLPRWLIITGVLVSLIIPAFLLILLTWFTRRRGEQGVGGWTTSMWILLTSMVSGVAILQESKLILVGSCILILFLLLVAIHPVKRVTYFFWRPEQKRLRPVVDVMICYGLFILIANTYAFLYAKISGHPLENQLICSFLRDEGIVNKVSLLLAISLLIPIIEEIVFRGFLIDVLRRKISWGWSIGIGALVFGILHGLTVFIPIMTLGILTGYLRKKYHNLWPSIALHCINNLVSVFVIWLEFS